jgi:hypothetical protein
MTASNADQLLTNIVVANTTPTGVYTYSAITNTASAVAKTGTFYVSSAPTKAAFNLAAYTAEGTATAAATVALTDINGNPSYLISGEAVQITSSATAAISSVILLDSGNYTQAVGTTGNIATNLSNSAGTAGAYTFTASAASGQTGFTSGTATLTVSAAPATVETITLATGTLAIGRDTADGVGNRTNTDATSAALGATSIFVAPTQTAVTYKLVDTGEAAAKNFKYSISQTSNVPFPGGVAAVGPVYLPAAVTTAGSNGISASLTVTSTSALAGTGYTLTVEGGTHDHVYTVLYQTPVAHDIDLNDVEATVIAAVKLATTSTTVKVKDQFGSAFAGAVVSYTTATRNTVAVKTAVSGADGTATISTTDAALSTVTTDDALNATIPTVALISGTYTGATFDGTANTTIKYYATAADIAAATVTLAANRPTTAGTTATYDLVVTTSTTASVTVDTAIGSANSDDQKKIADQVLITATVANAAAANPQGVPVSVSGSDGVFFLAGNTIGDVLMGTQTGFKTTLKSYTGSSGTYAFQAGFTKAGTATITVTSGTVSKTYSIKVVAGVAGIVSATSATKGVVVAKVTDLWGNPVSGATVSFVAASGALLGGNFPSLSASTGVDGTASTVVTGTSATTSYIVSATITGGDSATAADTTNGVPAGVATVDATSNGVGVSQLDAITILIDALNAKIVALNALIAKIMRKLGVK